MSEQGDLLAQLEAALRKGSYAQRSAIIRAIAEIFLSKEAALGEAHIALFDELLCGLILHVESETTGELSEQIAASSKAPPRLIRRFAQDEVVEIAVPVLSRSPLLTEPELITIALQKGQKHLEAIASRASLGQGVTDILIDRGSFQVARMLAGNAGAQLSDNGLTKLVTKSSFDERLAALLAARSDLPPSLFRTLIKNSGDAVRNALASSNDPGLRANIEQALATATEPVPEPPPVRRNRDYTKAAQRILDLKPSPKKLKQSMYEFAARRLFDETVVGLATLTKIPVPHIESLFDEPPANLVILCKSVLLPWETVRRILSLYAAETGQDAEISKARSDWQKLTPAMAQRVVRFWNVKAKPDTEAAPRQEAASAALSVA